MQNRNSLNYRNSKRIRTRWRETDVKTMIKFYDIGKCSVESLFILLNERYTLKEIKDKLKKLGFSNIREGKRTELREIMYESVLKPKPISNLVWENADRKKKRQEDVEYIKTLHKGAFDIRRGDNNTMCGLLELTEKKCKWPLGDPGSSNFKFCGAESNRESPYCEKHRKIAYSTNENQVEPYNYVRRYLFFRKNPA